VEHERSERDAQCEQHGNNNEEKYAAFHERSILRIGVARCARIFICEPLCKDLFIAVKSLLA
jgi:hypothetical protein